MENNTYRQSDGLILEGGNAGVFTCGVLDNFVDRGIRFHIRLVSARVHLQRIVFTCRGAGRAKGVQQYRPAGSL